MISLLVVHFPLNLLGCLHLGPSIGGICLDAKYASMIVDEHVVFFSLLTARASTTHS